MPGINSALRYIAADGREPKFAAVYDLKSPSVLEPDDYQSLFPKASDNEKSIISRISYLQRRVYTLISTLQHPSTLQHSATAGDPSALPGKYALLVFWQPFAESEVEFDKW